jgi:hypothetical protein
MANPPTVQETVNRLRELLGPESQAGEGLLRWWLNHDHPPKSVAVWIRCDHTNADDAPGPDDPCVVWVTRPYSPEQERCPVTSMTHLEEFIARVQQAVRADGPDSIKGLCPRESEVA